MGRAMESWIMRLTRMTCSRDNFRDQYALLEKVAADPPDGLGGVVLSGGFL